MLFSGPIVIKFLDLCCTCAKIVHAATFLLKPLWKPGDQKGAVENSREPRVPANCALGWSATDTQEEIDGRMDRWGRALFCNHQEIVTPESLWAHFHLRITKCRRNASLDKMLGMSYSESNHISVLSEQIRVLLWHPSLRPWLLASSREDIWDSVTSGAVCICFNAGHLDPFLSMKLDFPDLVWKCGEEWRPKSNSEEAVGDNARSPGSELGRISPLLVARNLGDSPSLGSVGVRPWLILAPLTPKGQDRT